MDTPRVPFRMCTILACLIGALTLACFARPAAAQTRRPTIRVHHTVVGDLLTMRAAKKIDERIRQAGDAKVDTFILELAGDRWRADLVHEIAVSLRASRVRTVVWLRDANDRSVGAGQAVLGMIAGECWIDPGTQIIRRPGDDDAALAPKGTNHGKLSQEVMRWAAETSRDRNADPLLARVLLDDPAPMWAIDELGDGKLRLAPTEPPLDPAAPSRATPLNRTSADGVPEIVLDADVSVALRLSLGTASRAADMFTRRGVSPALSGAMGIDASLDDILRAAAESLDALDLHIESIGTELDAKPRDQRVNTGKFYRELGAKVLERTAKARAALAACEDALTKDPEIARTPPPGTTAVGADADSFAARWRQTFQKRRDQIARLEKKARGFAGQ